MELILKVFEADNQKSEIRIAKDDDGRVVFAAYDVATLLGYKDPKEAIDRHCKMPSVYQKLQTSGGPQNFHLKAKIASLRSNNEDLEHENREMQATLCNMGVTYQQLYTVEHAILRHITNAPGRHSGAALESLVRRDVKCTNADYWHAMSDLYNRYKIRQNRAGLWELAR